jgi:hypothetical protein
MAELEKKFFGNLKGSLGDVVFRSRNEKNYVAHKPKSYNAPVTAGFKERTGKFKISVKLASAIYSFYPLKKIWTGVVASGKSAFTHLVQINYPFVEDGNITNMIAMVPRSSFGVDLQNLTMDNTALSIELAPLAEASNIDTSIEKQIQILAVVFLQQPVQAGLPDYDFLKITSAKIDIDTTNPVVFNIPLLTADSSIAGNYTNKKVMLTAITYDETGAVVQFSSTVNHTV